MERREHSRLPWRWLANKGQFIVDVQGNIVAEIPCQGCNPKDGEFIVEAVNQHAALVEQRSVLIEALREIAAFDDESANQRLTETGSYSSFDEPGAVRAARTAIATIEQGDEGQTKGGSG